MAEPREVIVVSPYQRVTQSLKSIITLSEPTAVVAAISELNGLITIEPAGGIGWGKDYPSLRRVDFRGQNWHYDSGENFSTYVERQLRDVNEEMVREMIEVHHPSLVIDLEQLIGNMGDVIGVYNIVGFGNWCTQNQVPRLVLPAEMKSVLSGRLQGDGFQGAHTDTPYLDDDEQRRAESDIKLALAGNSRGFSLFRYQG